MISAGTSLLIGILMIYVIALLLPLLVIVLKLRDNDLLIASKPEQRTRNGLSFPQRLH